MTGITEFKNNVGKYIVATIIGVLALTCVLLVWQHNVLQEKYTNSQVTVGQLQLQNDALIRDKKQHEESEAATKIIIAGLQTELQEKSKTYDQANAIVNDKVGAIIKKYDKLEKNDVNRVAMEKEISAARISGLWKAYCIANPEHERCKAETVK